jgi:hypothetical protein
MSAIPAPRERLDLDDRSPLSAVGGAAVTQTGLLHQRKRIGLSQGRDGATPRAGVERVETIPLPAMTGPDPRETGGK